MFLRVNCVFLCRFLSIAESEIGVGTDFSLESMSKKLGTNRRRIYDIINVLEALEMIVKQSKNWYTWLGQEGLLVTLAKMRVGDTGLVPGWDRKRKMWVWFGTLAGSGKMAGCGLGGPGCVPRCGCGLRH